MSPQRKKIDKSSNSKIKAKQKTVKNNSKNENKEVPIQMHNNLKKNYE